jgi:transcription elongation factor Elf1
MYSVLPGMIDWCVLYNPKKDGGPRMTITTTEYGNFEQAFDYFNRELFDGKLSSCLITLQRKGRRTFGYYSADRFRHRARSEFTDEIALNPAKFEGRSDLEILSTLVHEMVHQFQRIRGNPGRGRYHNREWADMMIERGLIPSITGEPGGRQTGDSMSHYIREGGRFEQACQKLFATGFKLNWQSVEKSPRNGGKAKEGNGRAGTAAASSGRDKFTCPKCGLNAWAKPSAALICGVCYHKGHTVLVMRSSSSGDDFSDWTDEELTGLSLTLGG